MISSHPTEPGRLYAGTTSGLYISLDAGQTWESDPWQLSELTIQSISFNPADPKYIYVSTKTHGVMQIPEPD